MKKLVILLISFTSMINFVVGRSGRITSYSHNDTGTVFSCDENPSSCSFTEIYINCNREQLSKADLKRISFDCSFPKLSLSEHFLNCGNLQTLDLSNVDLETLKKEDFEVFPTITEINLSHNKLTKIPANIFAKNVNLLSLNFSFNQISEIDPLATAGATKLRNIDLSSNSLTKLEPMLLGSKSLQFLNVSQNVLDEFNWKGSSIEHLNFGVFGNSLVLKYLILPSNLVSLNAAGNQIHRIHIDEDLKQLKYLNVSGCGIQNMNEVIANLDSPLLTLDASHNFIGKLNQSTFIKLKSLKYLHLKATNLSNIQYSTFHHQQNIKTLDISYNDLKTINFTYFWDIFNFLDKLYVDGNDLNDLNGLTKTYFGGLKELGISNNFNFHCDYLSFFLRSWIYVKLIGNTPSTAYHVDGIDCNPFSGNQPDDTSTEDSKNTTEVIATKDIKILIYLLSFMCAMYFIHILMKLIIYIYLRKNSLVPSNKRV